MNNADIIARATGSTRATVIHETRNAANKLVVTRIETTGTFDYDAAWEFITNSYGDFSLNRRKWCESDILTFVHEYHVGGIDAFIK